MTRRRRCYLALHYAWLRADHEVWEVTRYPLAGWIIVLAIYAFLVLGGHLG